jgi:hypothetical protein
MRRFEAHFKLRNLELLYFLMAFMSKIQTLHDGCPSLLAVHTLSPRAHVV